MSGTVLLSCRSPGAVTLQRRPAQPFVYHSFGNLLRRKSARSCLRTAAKKTARQQVGGWRTDCWKAAVAARQAGASAVSSASCQAVYLWPGPPGRHMRVHKQWLGRDRLELACNPQNAQQQAPAEEEPVNPKDLFTGYKPIDDEGNPWWEPPERDFWEGAAWDVSSELPGLPLDALTRDGSRCIWAQLIVQYHAAVLTAKASVALFLSCILCSHQVTAEGAHTMRCMHAAAKPQPSSAAVCALYKTSDGLVQSCHSSWEKERPSCCHCF